jgi:signal transduction histidine kinase
VRSYAVGQSPGEGNRAGVVIEFEDTGTGMTEEQRSRAFNSLLATTKEKGTGLGLAIVGRIVEAHRGSASILTGCEGGTRIVLSLPLN